LRGENQEALETAREAHRLLESLRNIESGESLVRLVMAEALDATGAADEARSIINQACDVLRTRANAISRTDWRRSFLENIPDHVRMLALAERWQR
jgi:thioredoxin-like negative regulator of GroEL